MPMMLKVEGDVFGTLRKQSAKFFFCVRITDFIEHVWIPAGHVRYDEIGSIYLLVYTIQNRIGERLFVDPLGDNAAFVSHALNAKFIDVLKFIVKRHKDESKRFSGHDHTPGTF